MTFIEVDIRHRSRPLLNVVLRHLDQNFQGETFSCSKQKLPRQRMSTDIFGRLARPPPWSCSCQSSRTFPVHFWTAMTPVYGPHTCTRGYSERPTVCVYAHTCCRRDSLQNPLDSCNNHHLKPFNVIVCVCVCVCMLSSDREFSSSSEWSSAFSFLHRSCVSNFHPPPTHPNAQPYTSTFMYKLI